MKNFLMAFAMVLINATVAHSETLYVNSPGDGYLNLRQGPGGSYKIIREMQHGTSVEVLRKSNNWLKVRHQSGASGWAYSKYLQRSVNTQKVNAKTLYVNSPGDGYLNLRKGPGGSHAVLRRMSHGSRMEVLGRSNSWLKVRHQSGTIGWAHQKYMVTNRPSSGSSPVNVGVSSRIGIIRGSSCVDLYRQFESKGASRAFALSSDGLACAWGAGYPTLLAAVNEATRGCTSQGRGRCNVHKTYNIARTALPEQTSGCVPSKNWFNFCAFVDNPETTGLLLLGAGALLKGIASVEPSFNDTPKPSVNAPTSTNTPSRKKPATGFRIFEYIQYSSSQVVVARGRCNNGKSFDVKYYPSNGGGARDHAIYSLFGSSVDDVAGKFCS